MQQRSFNDDLKVLCFSRLALMYFERMNFGSC